MNTQPTWPMAFIVVAVIALIGFLMHLAFKHGGLDAAITIWALLAPLVGIVIGAVPAYAYGRHLLRSQMEIASLNTALSKIRKRA